MLSVRMLGPLQARVILKKNGYLLQEWITYISVSNRAK
jgi:hypothetical protein